MAKKERTLVLDIGSTAIHAGEFEVDPVEGRLILHAFENVEFSEYPNETNRVPIIAEAIRKVLSTGQFTARSAHLCVSGQAAFMRFVKLPPVTDDDASIKQIVEYEARQNVPFPMDEVIWDYQLIGSNEEDLEVMFAVIKNEMVDGVINAVTNAGLKPRLVDFAPAALYNAARANSIGEEECAMLLDIGGRCTNLLFLDSGRFFARAIPIAGYSITQQIAKEFGISPEEAEILKRRHGFVALGGAYEEPESEVAATISKIIRNVMTRLHGEINRSINVYRTQQKGNKPTSLYLAGGSSIMQFTDTFFSEKLRMEVFYFNPFKIVNRAAEIDKVKLEANAHVMPEVVGVALRSVIQCPVEINLTTDSMKQADAFNRRKPYIILSAVVWLSILAVFVVINKRKIHLYDDAISYKKGIIDKFGDFAKQIEQANKKQNAAVGQFNQINDILEQRYRWAEVYNSLQLSKPNDIWLVYVRPKDGPTRQIAAEASAETSSLIDIFGGGVATGAEAVQETKSDEISWIEISGHAINIPEHKPNESETYIRPIFSEEQIAIFKESAERQIKAVTEAEKDPEQRAAKGKYIDDFMSSVNNNIESDNTTLPEVFLSSLRFNEAFSELSSDTAFVSFAPDPVVSNLTSFIIQVKLKKPIKFAR